MERSRSNGTCLKGCLSPQKDTQAGSRSSSEAFLVAGVGKTTSPARTCWILARVIAGGD